MADTKLTAETALGAKPASGDLLYVVDVSDTTDDAAGTSKSVTYNQIAPYSLLKADGNNSSANIANTEVAIAWSSADITVGNSDVSLGGTPQSDITINTTGTYKFTVCVQADGNNRVDLEVRTYIDTGGGYSQDTQEVTHNYALRDIDQNVGTTVHIVILSLTSSDVVEFRAYANADGTATLSDLGTRLIVERLA